MITVLSLGAGVQSSTLALMAAHGEVGPMPSCAIFADTGWEPKAVYAWLDWLEAQLPYPVHRVAKGNIREEQIIARVRGLKGEDGSRWASLPYFTKNPDGSVGLIRRQCTSEYKIQPIEKFIRKEILGLEPRQRAPKELTIEQWYGISLDEIQRCKAEFVEPWRRNRYPLIEKRMTRGHCLEWMAKNSYPAPPRSSCLGCPFHSEEEWQRIKDGPQDEWVSVVEFDKAIRKAGGMQGDTFIHRSCKPIGEVQFATVAASGQYSMLDECEGMCGV